MVAGQPRLLEVREAGRHQPLQYVGRRRVAGRAREPLRCVRAALPHQDPGQHGNRLTADHAGVVLSVQQVPQRGLCLRPLAAHQRQPGPAGGEHVAVDAEVPVPAEALRLLEVAERLTVLAEPPQALDEVVVGPHDVLVVVELARLRHASQQVLAPARVAQLQPGGPPVVAAQRGHAGGPAPFGDAERLVQVRQSVRLPVDDHEQAAQVQRGQRVLVAVAERAGQLERALGRRARGGGSFGQPLLPGQGDYVPPGTSPGRNGPLRGQSG